MEIAVNDAKLVVNHVFSGNVTAANPVLGIGHAVMEKDTGRVKVGDGITSWNDLPYVD